MDLNGDTVIKRQHIVVFVAIVNALRVMYTSQKKYYALFMVVQSSTDPVVSEA